jgi:hypothetical protein
MTRTAGQRVNSTFAETQACFTTIANQGASNPSTMNSTKVLLTVWLWGAVSLASAFTPTGRTLWSTASVSMSVKPLASTQTMSRAWMLRMSSDNEGETDQVAPSKKAPTSGTFYDDEVSHYSSNLPRSCAYAYVSLLEPGMQLAVTVLFEDSAQPTVC